MFSRTQNDNGTFDTRCLYCFMTIASSIDSIEDLERIETHHLCPEKVLSELLANRTAASTHVHTR